VLVGRAFDESAASRAIGPGESTGGFGGMLAGMATLIDIDPARQLAAAEHDLVADFPAVAPAEIHSMILRENKRYDAARIRDYISILVARSVRAALLDRSSSRRILRRTQAH
jgi:hypothetical protein